MLAVLVLSSLAVLNASASDEVTITATVGDSVDWRTYFTKPDGFITWNPHVWDYDDAGYQVVLSGEEGDQRQAVTKISCLVCPVAGSGRMCYKRDRVTKYVTFYNHPM